MATILDDEEQKQKEQGGEQIVSGESGLVNGGGSAGTGGAQQKGGNAGGFTNLQSYVTANQGNDAQMGQQVQGAVAKDAQAADQATGSYLQNAQSGAEKGAVKQDQSVIDAVKTSPDKVDKDAWNKQYNAQYGGPDQASQVDGYEPAYSANDKVAKEATAAKGDNASRQGLLSSVYERPGYSQGERSLDSFILGAGAGGQQALQNISSTYGKYGTAADDASKKAQGYIDTAKQTTADTAKAAKDALAQTGDQYRGKFANLQKTLGDTNSANATQYQGLVGDLSSNDPVAHARGLSAIGLDQNTESFLKSEGYSPSQILGLAQQSAGKGLGDVVSEADQAKWSALRNLGYSGDDYDFSKQGGDGSAYHVDTAKIDAAKKARQLLTNGQLQLQTKQHQRDSDYDSLRSGLMATGLTGNGPTDEALTKLGISRDDYDLISKYGTGDIGSVVSGGRKLGLADSMSQSDLAQFSNLMGTLGLKPKEDVATYGDAGGGYNIDKAALDKIVGQARGRESAAAPGNSQVAQMAEGTKKAAKGPIPLPSTNGLNGVADSISSIGKTKKKLHW